MVCKLTKFFTTCGILSIFLSFSGENLYADGDYMHSKKKPCHKKMEQEHHQPMMMNNQAYCEQPMMPARPCDDQSKFSFGIGVDFGFGINGNSDFNVPIILADEVDNPDEVVPPRAISGNSSANNNNYSEFYDSSNAIEEKVAIAANTVPFTFSQKRDNLYGGFVNFGYMFADGLETGIEVAYRQLTNKDKNNALNSMETDIFSGILKISYFFNLFNGMIIPYLSVGGGIARNKVKATLYDTTSIATANVIKINDLIKNTFTYQGEIGAATEIDQFRLGVVYKFFGVASFDDYNSDATITVFDPKGDGGPLDVPFSFGSIKNNTHNISVFMRVSI